MRFNSDFLPGQLLTFEEIARRYALKYPDDKELTSRGLLSPSTISKQNLIRAVFAHREFLSPLEDLLFISGDNERKNYLKRFEHYLQRKDPFLYFRRHLDNTQGQWKVMGESRVLAIIDPASTTLHNLLQQRGYQLVMMREEEGQALWQLFDLQQQPCFATARPLEFVVVLTSVLLPPASGVVEGATLGLQSKKRVWQRTHEARFLDAVTARYGACVVTGTPLLAGSAWPWVEASYIDTQCNEQGVMADTEADNGLFLRSDLRQLFDNHLFTIAADNGTVQFRRFTPDETQLSQFYTDIDGAVCALWDRVPLATRERLKRRR
ncbi:HNH endonuclease [Enterobacterales bacterium CwR94]|nr:HNH endonuclease [Enterobacterales bacterium CwR94]